MRAGRRRQLHWHFAGGQRLDLQLLRQSCIFTIFFLKTFKTFKVNLRGFTCSRVLLHSACDLSNWQWSWFAKCGKYLFELVAFWKTLPQPNFIRVLGSVKSSSSLSCSYWVLKLAPTLTEQWCSPAVAGSLVESGSSLSLQPRLFQNLIFPLQGFFKTCYFSCCSIYLK